MSEDVKNLLVEKEVKYVQKGKDLLIKCLNPEHEDSSPSMRVDALGGQFHCLACGYKGNIFTYFNRVRNIFHSKVLELKKKALEVRKASWPGFFFPDDAFFVTEPFKGIPAEIIQKFQAFKTFEMGMTERIVFPIYDPTNRLVAFQGRYTHTNISPKYLVYPAETSLPWYPSANRCTFHQNSIILVEGLKDALYLHGQGITNAVCIFGTKSVNADNIVDHLTQFMLAGVEKVYIMLDGDQAGRSASKHIYDCVKKKTSLLVEEIELPDGIDPASMEDENIDSLKNYLQIT
jgi:DNA primase